MADLRTVLDELAGPQQGIDVEVVRRRVERRRRDRRVRRATWLGAAAVLLVVVLVSTIAVARSEHESLQVGGTGAAPPRTEAPDPLPGATELAERARQMPPFVPPAGGFQRLRTSSTTIGYVSIDGGYGGEMRTRVQRDQWIAADGRGRTFTVQIQVDEGGAPLPQQVVGFGIEFSTEQAPGEVPWGADHLATMPVDLPALESWLAAVDLPITDADPDTVSRTIAVVLSWPAVPPEVRAALIERLAREPGFRIERAAEPRLVRLTVDGGAWIELDEERAVPVRYGDGGGTSVVVVEVRGVAEDLPSPIDPPTSADLTVPPPAAGG